MKLVNFTVSQKGINKDLKTVSHSLRFVWSIKMPSLSQIEETAKRVEALKAEMAELKARLVLLLALAENILREIEESYAQ